MAAPEKTKTMDTSERIDGHARVNRLEKTKMMDTSERIDDHARVNRRPGVGANGDEAGRWSDWRWKTIRLEMEISRKNWGK
uniref:Uncharacterized protein n=1 Tax=Cucumis sativus TaxID=3659 RepID=A0A0A0LU48_CUCSA